MLPGLAVILVLGALLLSGVKVVREYERGVVLRLGRITGARGPGLIYVVPFVEQMYRLDLRTITLDVPSQDVITRDNVSVKVSAVLYFRVVDPNRAVVEVQNFLYATSQLAQTALRSVCGQAHLDELLAERDKFNALLQQIIDTSTEPWGVKVVLVEVKNIDLAEEMRRTIAQQAEAERLRRAKVISAEGEYQAADRLAEAAKLMEKGVAMQLRYLQTLTQIGAENNQTVLFPFPADLLRTLLGTVGR